MMVAMEEKKTAKVPAFRPGDTVKVHMKVKEGDSERIQVFEGTVISRRGRGASETFTVRKISFGVGVERTFPVTTPTWSGSSSCARARSAARGCTTSAA